MKSSVGVFIFTLMAGVVYAGLHWGTFAVGGSDSYCYVHQAEGWASARLQVVEPLALEAPWPDAPLTFAPAGHLPSRTLAGAIVPLCPAGFSIVMAPFMAVGGPHAVFLVVPLFGALLVLACYIVGARFGVAVGIASAILAACGPVFLFQLMQPMSDVPAAALWMLAVACATGTGKRTPVAAGLAAGAGILIRPNLLPLGLVIGLALLLRPERSWPERVRSAGLFAAGCAPGCLAVAAVQQIFYGSMVRSGYGTLDSIFSTDHIVPNAERYRRWMWQTHTPAWVLAAAAPLLLPGWLTTLLVALVLTNVACYLPYTSFEDWWYLRFLLPTIPLLLILTVAVVEAACRRMVSAFEGRSHQRSRHAETQRHRDNLSGTDWKPLALSISSTQSRWVRLAPCLVVAAFTAVLVTSLLAAARRGSVFELARFESRYERAGTFVARRLPANALVITSWESGSVRFYSGRRTLVWDVLDPAWLDRAVDFARTRGLEPYLLFERWEEPVFRERFRSSPLAALDWPPMAEIASQVRIYRPGDRAEYYRGNPTPTEYAR